MIFALISLLVGMEVAIGSQLFMQVRIPVQTTLCRIFNLNY